MEYNLLLNTSAQSLSPGWLVFSAVLMVMALTMMFYPRTPASLVAYMSMWAGYLSGYTPFSTGDMIFWAVATVIVLANNRLLPRFVSESRRGLGYIAGGAITGMIVGLTFYRPASVILGAALGAFIGAVAYARTSAGTVLDFPHSKFFNYLGAKGIPATVTASMVGLVVSMLIARSLVE